MVLGYHLILTAYGFWLPNDERGSWSEFVGSWELLRFGEATKVTTRRSLARRAFDPTRRDAARAALKYPAVTFTGRQARAIGQGFARYARRAGVLIHACAILPDHVHMVVALHRLRIEEIATQLKGAATRRLAEEGIHPLAAYRRCDGRVPQPWARGQWKVFLNSPTDIRRAIRYTQANPRREGLPDQRWVCVTPYDDERSTASRV